MSTPRLLMIQPGRFGDILICLPIAAHFAKLGFEVHWPLPEKYRDIMSSIPYVSSTFIQDRNEWDILPTIYSRTSHFDRVVDLSFGFPESRVEGAWSRAQTESFVSTKYRLAGVPIEERRRLRWRRNPNKEDDLFELLVRGVRPYAFVHRETWCGAYKIALPALALVMAKPIPGYNLFDWRRVLTESSEIACIDSAFANLVEILPECAGTPKRVFLRGPTSISSLFESNWEKRLAVEEWRPVRKVHA